LTSSIRLDEVGAIAELVLNQPVKRNALSIEMWSAIPGLIDKAEANKECKVILVHGGGAGAFAAGADISEFEEIYATPERAEQSGQTIAAALTAVETCTKPVIAAIDGACVGGGVSLAMAADLRIASQGSKFGVTPGKLGLVYSASDTRRLLAAIGAGATKDILFTGRIILADEAKQMGLIDRLVDKGQALTQARELAKEISTVSQWSVRATKQMIQGLTGGWRDDSARAHALFQEGFSNADFMEGYKAFLEKRSPKFTL
jgi:enoyl-CoA hydratase/carnithine racemase